MMNGVLPWIIFNFVLVIFLYNVKQHDDSQTKNFLGFCLMAIGTKYVKLVRS